VNRPALDRGGLDERAASCLRHDGFVVLDGPFDPEELTIVRTAYDAAVAQAGDEDRRVGRTTTRVTDFVNRDAIFDRLYIDRPILAAGDLVIGGPCRLSVLHARTLHAGAFTQALHQDFPADGQRRTWPMLGFIFMVDPFTEHNGATRFVPGSHRWGGVPPGPSRPGVAEVAACGPAGSVTVFNGSVWHGHGPNATPWPRRSIQGAFIARGESTATDWARRMRPETLARIGPLAKRLLGLDDRDQGPGVTESLR
jgi:ectoine hydroxylase-related dioxygenase (phytanoyl-CoA dioxygenase family)